MTANFAWLLLVVAGLLEIVWSISMKASHGFTKPHYTIITLVAAALFRPVRGRVQSLIDRRFNRARYDATRTIERFAARLREETDIDSLAADLERIVAEAIQPSHVALWLRDRA